jgi:two-component system, NtrC family, nitrogen regulation response regulator NtrX
MAIEERSVTGATVLVVDDDPDIRESLAEIFEREGHSVREAGDGRTALERLDREEIDLVLLDLEIPRVSGIEILQRMAEKHLDIPVIIVSGTGTIPVAVRALRLGALDFLEKPLDIERIRDAARRALERMRRRPGRNRSAAEAWERYGMIGTSAGMQRVYEWIDRAAGSRATVLVLGESGTGKELVARAVHTRSPRGRGPYVAFNCAATPETLIDSELFGHAAGAFTGARGSHRGRFAQASGGSLFLDEVGDMSLMMQAKVLRVMEEGRVQPVGAERPAEVDVRLVAATHRDLRADVDAGRFREDLYYRLNVITIRLPPLRSRIEDIAPLAHHFLRLGGAEDPRPLSFSPAALAVLGAHRWPGNVRELRNVVERLVVSCSRERIDTADVEDVLHDAPPEEEPAGEGLRALRDRVERAYIVQTLEATGWRIQETAARLGIDRTYLWKLMRRLGIEPPSGEPRPTGERGKR